MKLQQKVGKVIAVNPRKEHHGENLALSVDVKVEANCTREDIAQFDPTLGDFLFGEHGPRFPEIGAVPWGREYERCIVKLNKVELKDTTVRKITLLPQEGESVKVGFMATLYPSQKTVGDLANLIQEDVAIEVEQTQVDLVDTIKNGESEPADA